ncbi:MAG: peptidoglycan editing factor PgeF [Woeseia sp.]
MTSVRWIRADWPAPPGIVAGTTLRQGGVGRDNYATLNLAAHVGDAEGSVDTNRRRFASACNLPAAPLWLTQVHGKNVVRAETAGDAPEADAIVTGRADTVCAVLTADCLPVVFASVNGKEIAAAHAGWRGLCAGVLEATVAAFSTPPSGLMAWFGPAISQPAFEVGDEVRASFLARDPAAAGSFSANERGRWQADLYGLAALTLRKTGVTRIYGGGRCTFNEPEAYFSHRRDGQCGRMATFVFRTDA